MVSSPGKIKRLEPQAMEVPAASRWGKSSRISPVSKWLGSPPLISNKNSHLEGVPTTYIN